MEWFQKIHDFISAIEGKAEDAAHKGADMLRSWADWLDKLAFSAIEAPAGPDDKALDLVEKKCGKIKADCEGMKSIEEPPDPKKIDPATIIMLVNLILTFISEWRKRHPRP